MYDVSLAQDELVSLADVLNVMKLYENKAKLWMPKLESKLQDEGDNDLKLITMTYDAMKTKMVAKIVKISKDVSSQSIVNNETKDHEQKRTDYFRQLSPKILALRRYCDEHGYLKNHIEAHFKGKYVDYFQQKYVQDIEDIRRSICDDVKSDHFFDDKILTKINVYLICMNSFKVECLDSSNELFDAIAVTKLESLIKQCTQFVESRFSDLQIKVVNDVLGGKNKKAESQQTRNIKSLHRTTEDVQKELQKMQQFAKCLINLMKGSRLLNSFGKRLEKPINELLLQYQKLDPESIGPLALELERIDVIWGSMLVSQQEIFRGQLIVRFNRKAHGQTLQDVVDNMDYNTSKKWLIYRLTLNRNSVISYYTKFEEKYSFLLQTHLKDESPSLQGLLTTIKTQNCQLAKQQIIGPDGKLKNKYWQSATKEHVIEILAYIFAIWTLDNSKHYYEAPKGIKDREYFLMKPKYAQVISIIRLLDIDATTATDTFTSTHEICRNLVEIGTGEGKSLTMAVTACLLALIGFDVRCVCYSDYLSKRDNKEFSKLFELFGVSHNIEYSTLHNLVYTMSCGEINFGDETEALLWDKLDTKPKMINIRPRVILLDEVDVLFGDSFFGQSYGTCTFLRHAKVSKLCDYIWNRFYNYSETLTLPTLQTRVVYKNVKSLFDNNCMRLVDKVITRMLSCLKVFHKSEYKVFNRSTVKYRQMDSYAELYGNETLWIYYLEHAKRNIDNIEHRKGLRITTCDFSFIKLVKSFDLMLGVTGTLKDVVSSSLQRDAIEEIFEVQKYTYMPTLYKRDPKLPEKTESAQLDIIVVENNRFYNRLVEEIVSRLMDHSGDQRCVFVFFEDVKKLEAFDNSIQFAVLRENRILLREDMTDKEKDLAVIRACMSESVLLATKTFGRGTDFRVRDDKVAYNGGPHVLQTFFSLDKSEETQIRGRTARQGGDGSYSMILNKKHVMEKFEMKQWPNDQQMRQPFAVGDMVRNVFGSKHEDPLLYRYLHMKREDKFKKSFEALKEQASQENDSHATSEKLKSAFISNSKVEAINNLLKLN